MSNFVALLLTCSVACWQLSSGNGDSSDQVDKIMDKFDHALEGIAVLTSLMDGIEESGAVPDLSDLSETVTDVAAALPAIGAVFSLVASLDPNGQSAEVDVIEAELKHIEINTGMLSIVRNQAKTEKVSSTTYPYFIQYQSLMNELYGQYYVFIKNATCSQCKDRLIEVCGATRTDPQQNFNRLVETITTTGNFVSEMLDYLMIDANYDWTMLRKNFRIIMSYAIKTALLNQACLGLKVPNDYAAYRTRAKEDENNFQNIIVKLQETAKVLLRDAREKRLQKDVEQKLETWDNGAMGSFTVQLKDFLDQKYPWLLWNVHSFSNMPELAKTEETNHQVHHFTKPSVASFIVTFSDTESYKTKANCLRNMKRAIEASYATKSCTEVNTRDINRVVENICADTFIVSDLSNSAYSAISDNTVGLRVCKFYIALSVLGRVS